MNSDENNYRKYLLKSLKNAVFSGAAVAFSKLKKGGKFKTVDDYVGFTGLIEDSPSVHKEVFFDLASLTKPLVTVLSLFNLVHERNIKWNEKINSLLCTKVPEDKKDITLLDLMNHRAGFPAHRDYFSYFQKENVSDVREKIVDLILNERLEYEPGTRSLYSDLDYILLGRIIEKIKSSPLDAFWKRRIACPLTLQNNLLFSHEKKLDCFNSAATVVDPSTLKPLYGIVNDDNCRLMGGVSGHAGLFGTLQGVMTLCQELVKQYLDISQTEAYSNVLFRNALSTRPNTPWVYGFDRPSLSNSSAGQYFSRNSIGHLGYTGTSFWIDLEKKFVAVVLTNRVLLNTAREDMFFFRRKIHDLLFERYYSIL